MITKGQRDLFERSIIAQDDDQDYSESGYVVVRVGEWCAISRYGHCSCYDTWCDLTGGCMGDSEGDDNPRWDWQGTYQELLDMAKRKADPALPERPADEKDYDFDHLMKVYDTILAKGTEV